MILKRKQILQARKRSKRGRFIGPPNNNPSTATTHVSIGIQNKSITDRDDTITCYVHGTGTQNEHRFLQQNRQKQQ